MIGLRAILLFLIFLLPSVAYAKNTVVHTGANVYSKTELRWKKAIQSASFDSTTWIWNLGERDRKHRNGSRDTILMVPASTIPDHLTVIVWFHGCNGFSQKTFSKRVVPQIEGLVEGRHSIAIAIPEMPWSTNTSTTCKRQGRVWTKSGELTRYVDSLKRRLEGWAINSHGVKLGSVRLVFVGHSAGGSALMAAAKEGSLCSLSPDAVVWSDASYGGWLDIAWKRCLKDTDIEVHILVRKWDKPHKNAQRVVKKIKKSKKSSTGPVFYHVLDRKVWSHGNIGDSVFDLTNIFPPGC
tara:strand:- start:3808 stop:4695 length:888 start_codon:yes stop_codon:yes gene_type:complete